MIYMSYDQVVAKIKKLEKLTDDEIDRQVWECAYAIEDFLLHCCKYYGWQGGTIHQVILEICKAKEIIQ